MNNENLKFRATLSVSLLACSLTLLSVGAVAQTAISGTAANGELSIQQVVRNLESQNQRRADALLKFQGTRVYQMQYRGVPGDKDAEMTVEMNYQAPSNKRFTVVSQSGSKFILDHVFKKLLEGEQEAAQQENRRRTALNSENYDFSMAGFESSSEGGNYVLNVLPKTKSKFLYNGKIWVDAKDFAVTRIEAEPAKNPSFWIKKSEIKHRYVKVDGFWLPAENRSESDVRLGGHAVLSIRYKDYKIKDASPLPALTAAEPQKQAANIAPR